MTTNTQSVCKHCDELDREFAHLKSANTGAWQYRNEHGHWVTCETQRPVAEPASTGEQPPALCAGCGEVLPVGHAEIYQPSTGKRYHARCEYLAARPGTPQAQGTPEPPKVEERLRAANACNALAREFGVDIDFDEVLRPYFPPASQTPDEKFQRHTDAVKEFLNELYAIMVDPLAEGTIKVADMCKALKDSALASREFEHDYRYMAIKLGECARRHGLGLGGEHYDDLVIAELDKLAIPASTQPCQLKAMTETDQEPYDPIAELEYIAKEINGDDIALEDLSGQLEFAIQVLKEMKEFAATPASTARTDGWVSVEESLPQQEIKRFQDDVQVSNGLRIWTRPVNSMWKREVIPSDITHWRELPAAPGSVPQAPQTEYDPCCGECGMNFSEHDGKDHEGGACANFIGVPKEEK